MKICIGIPTCERLDFLKITAKSLALLHSSQSHIVRIYDDASTSFSDSDLKGLFPNAEKIHVQPQRLGADRNTYFMYKDMLNSGADAFFCVDSDLVIHPKSLEVIEKILENTDGILSLYNSCAHNPVDEIYQEGEKVLVKNSLGAAGVCFSRERLADIVSHVRPSDSIDWDWSKYCNKNGIRLMSTSSSYLQHLGFLQGYNSDRPTVFDFGLNFVHDNPEINTLLLDSLSRSIVDNDLGVGARVQKVYDSYSFRLGKLLLSPAKFLRRKLNHRSRLS